MTATSSLGRPSDFNPHNICGTGVVALSSTPACTASQVRSRIVPKRTSPVTVTAKLRFRRAFQTVMDAKDWTSPDIIMEETQVTLTVQPWREVYLPLVLSPPEIMMPKTSTAYE